MDRVVQAGSESPFRAVLLLCDDAAVSGQVRAELDRLGVAISVHALTRRSDLERDLVASAPALVLLDPGMPGLNARDILLELRSRHPASPVLVLSSGPPDETVLDLLAAGAADCVLLPDMRRLGPALQRLSQNAAAPTDRLFRQLVETASDMLMLTALDGTVKYVSPAVKTLTGYAPEEVIGRRYLEFIVPEDAERARRYLAELVSSPGRIFQQELRIRCRDGRTLDVESAVSNQIDVPGIDGIVAEVRDISRSKASEMRLREANTLVEQSQTVLFRWTAQEGWPIVYVSNNVRSWGYDAEQLIASRQRYADLMHPDDVTEVVRQADAAVAAGQRQLVLEYRIVTKAGALRWMSEHTTIAYDDAGGVRYFQGVVTDVTERKMAEQELRLFRALIDRTSDAIEVLDPVTFQFLDCNEEAFQALGYSREELLRLTVFDIDPLAGAMDLESLAERLRNDEVIVFDTIHRRKDATEFPVEVSLRYVRQDRLYLVSVVRDITERKRAEEDLRASKEVIEGILDAIPVRVFWKDANLRYLGCNAAFARDAGYDEPRELIGKDDTEMGWREQAELYRADDRAVIESGQAKLLIEEPQTTPDGRTIVLLTSKLPLRDAKGAISGVLGTYMDVTEHKEHERALARQTRALTALSSGNSVLVHARTEAELYQDMATAIVEAGGYRMAWVGLAEHGEGLPVRPVGKAGDDTGYVDAAKLTWSDQTERGRGPSGLCIRTGQTVISRNIETDPAMAPWRDAARTAGFAASAAIPLKNGGDTFGELCIYSADPAAFDEDEITLLEEMAGDLAFGVIALRTRDANLNNLERLERSMEGTVRVLAGTVELRDPYTAGHQQRVATIADAIAGVMDLSEDRRQGLRLAAMVHDIGKLSVPSEILAKPGRLTNLEYQLVMAHAESGYEILKDVEFPWPVAEIVRQHHERVDGSGYPRGLSGEQILLEARILAVADTLEAMSTHRPYRPARGVDAALDVIAEGRGTLFDTAVVDACLELIRERHFSIPD